MLTSSDRPETRENQCTVILADDAVSAARQLQNTVFKRFGGVAWLIGVGGFLPTTLLGLYHGIPYSATSLKPHSDVDCWLCIHAVSMWLWCLAVAMQFWSGGQSQVQVKAIHRCAGYLGVGALSSGMMSGGIIYTIKYDFLVHDQIAPGYYTIVISVFAWVNMVVAIAKARQHRTAEHKDFVLMAFMWTMDPAVQRAAMHLLRWCLFRPDPIVLLAVGKLCGNVFLTLVFGCAAIVGHRENMVTVLNVAGQWVFGMMLSVGIFLGLSAANVDDRDLPLLAAVTIISDVSLLTFGFTNLWLKAEPLRRWRPTSHQLALIVAWALMVGGFFVAMLLTH